MKVLSFPELASLKGVRFSRQYVAKLVKAGRFPAPVKLGVATNAWDEAEIDAWLEERKRERDGVASAAA